MINKIFTLCLSSCCASQELKRYSLFGSIIVLPSNFLITSDVNRKVGPRKIIVKWIQFFLSAFRYFENRKKYLWIIGNDIIHM